MRALVTGAGGFIGSALVRRLSTDGHEVTAVVRRTGTAMPDRVRVCVASLGGDLPVDALVGLDVVVHLAHDMTPGSGRNTVGGTMRWFEQAARAATPLQIYVTSYSAHPSAPSEYGQTKYELEHYVAARGGTVVRPGLVLGRGGAFGAMADMVRRYPIVPVPGGDLRVFVTTIDDVVTAVTRIDRTMAGETLNVFAPEPVTLHELLVRTRTALGSRALVLSVPAAVARPLLRLVAPAHAALRRHQERLAALAASETYGFASASARLGLQARSIEAMVRNALRH